MRKLLASVVVAAALVGTPTLAADPPEYPDIEVPEVDYGLGGSFYLRGSAALNLHWAREVTHPGVVPPEVYSINQLGFGYSWGAGFGYETGDGLRFDATIDSVETRGLRITKAPPDPNAGDFTLMLRSTVALANVYYDFGFGGDSFGYTGAGGAFGYVGAGVGAARNHAEVNAPVGTTIPTGGNVTPAAALMAGVGYDMGTWVADVGYRGLYLHQINNAPTDPTTDSYYEVNNNWINELRGTVRYRFN